MVVGSCIKSDNRIYNFRIVCLHLMIFLLLLGSLTFDVFQAEPKSPFVNTMSILTCYSVSSNALSYPRLIVQICTLPDCTNLYTFLDSTNLYALIIDQDCINLYISRLYKFVQLHDSSVYFGILVQNSTTPAGQIPSANKVEGYNAKGKANS